MIVCGPIWLGLFWLGKWGHSKGIWDRGVLQWFSFDSMIFGTDSFSSSLHGFGLANHSSIWISSFRLLLTLPSILTCSTLLALISSQTWHCSGALTPQFWYASLLAEWILLDSSLTHMEWRLERIAESIVGRRACTRINKRERKWKDHMASQWSGNTGDPQNIPRTGC